MIFDPTYFSYGVGLVISGYMLGLLASIIFDVVRKVGQV